MSLFCVFSSLNPIEVQEERSALCSIGGGPRMKVGDFVSRQLAHDFANADHERAIGDLTALRDQGTGAYQTVLSDLGAVQDDRTYAYERTVADRASMNDSLMANCDVCADV